MSHSFRPRDSLRAPDPIIGSRFAAAIFLGELQRANGCSLEVIVRAAAEADCATAETTHPCNDHGDSCPINVTEFAVAIAREAMDDPIGTWTDEHASFMVPKRTHVEKRRVFDEIHTDGRFIIPPVNFAESERLPRAVAARYE